MFKRILTICHANICRSPVAEALLQYYIPDNNIEVLSAGVLAKQGCAASEKMTDLLASRKQINLSEHRSQLLTQKLATWADLILVMEESHKRHISYNFPSACGKIFLLSHWDKKDEIADPFGKTIEYYERSLTKIEDCVLDWCAKLKKVAA